MAQLARGDHDSVSAAPSPPPPPQESVSDAFAASKEAYHEDSDGNNSNVGHPKKPAWSKPLNGVVPVMGDAVSWPALSEATKPPSKSTPDLSNPNESVSASQAPVMSNPTQNQKKHANTNSNPNSAANPKSPARQRSLKRGGGTRAGPVQNGFIRAAPPPPPLPLPQPPPPIFPLFDLPYGALPAVPDYFPYNGNNWEGMPMGGFVPQSSSVSYQSSPRSSSRRGNFGGHHNGRNASRSSNVRDVRVPQQIAPPRGFLRPAPPPPPPGSIPFIRPHHVGPFGYPMGFDMPFPFVYVPTPPMESFNEVPFSAQAPPMPPLSSTVLDDPMHASLINQIDYYFCDDNLSRDDFLRSKMDDEGWVPLSLIVGFPKVQQWTNDIEVIFNSLKASSVVEVQPHKVRRRDEWKKWVSTPSRFAAGSGFQSTMGSTEKTITSSLLKVTLDEAAANKSSGMSEADSSTKVVPCTSTSEEVTGHANLANGDTTIEESCSSHL